jgi:hypothetical protein
MQSSALVWRHQRLHAAISASMTSSALACSHQRLYDVISACMQSSALVWRHQRLHAVISASMTSSALACSHQRLYDWRLNSGFCPPNYRSLKILRNPPTAAKIFIEFWCEIWIRHSHIVVKNFVFFLFLMFRKYFFRGGRIRPLLHVQNVVDNSIHRNHKIEFGFTYIASLVHYEKNEVKKWHKNSFWYIKFSIVSHVVFCTAIFVAAWTDTSYSCCRWWKGWRKSYKHFHKIRYFVNCISLQVCNFSYQYVNYYLFFVDSVKNNFFADVYVRLAVNGIME